MFDLSPFPDAALRGLILSIVGLLWVVAIVRVVGLRSFSKMTAFDFIVTLATGSLLATAASSSSWTSYLQAITAIVVLLGAQFVLAWMRKRSDAIEHSVENEPLLLMREGEFIDEAMRLSRVSRSDVIAKLRQANALRMSKVRAVVLEATGDISILHGDDLDETLLEDVRRLG